MAFNFIRGSTLARREISLLQMLLCCTICLEIYNVLSRLKVLPCETTDGQCHVVDCVIFLCTLNNWLGTDR